MVNGSQLPPRQESVLLFIEREQWPVGSRQWTLIDSIYCSRQGPFVYEIKPRTDGRAYRLYAFLPEGYTSNDTLLATQAGIIDQHIICETQAKLRLEFVNRNFSPDDVLSFIDPLGNERLIQSTTNRVFYYDLLFPPYQNLRFDCTLQRAESTSLWSFDLNLQEGENYHLVHY